MNVLYIYIQSPNQGSKWYLTNSNDTSPAQDLYWLKFPNLKARLGMTIYKCPCCSSVCHWCDRTQWQRNTMLRLSQPLYIFRFPGWYLHPVFLGQCVTYYLLGYSGHGSIWYTSIQVLIKWKNMMKKNIYGNFKWRSVV